MIKAFINNKIKSNIKKIIRTRDFIAFSQINLILIIYEFSDFHIAKDLELAFYQEGKKTILLGFNNSKEQIDTNDNEKMFSLKETNLFHFPNEKTVNEFFNLDKQCDLHINISSDNNLTLMYLSSLSKANLKIGVKTEINRLFDFMIDIPKNIDGKFLSQQIMFYLRKLKSQSIDQTS